MVSGMARRVRTSFNDDGKPGGLYCQTHLRLRSADDGKVVK